MGYFPNGTAGDAFYETHCAGCVHDEEWREHERNPCPVWNAHLLYSYQLCNEKGLPGKDILDMLIPHDGSGCAMQHPSPKVLAARDERGRLQLRLLDLQRAAERTGSR